MGRRNGSESRLFKIGTWLFAVVTPLSALALGSIPVEALAVVSVLAAVACALLWTTRDAPLPRSSRVLLGACLLLTGITALQVVPLPAGFVRVVAPENAEIWSRALSPLNEPGPAWHTISVAPLATREQVLRGLFYGLTFLSAVRVGAGEHGHRFLIRLVVVSTGIMAFVALVHWATSAERVFGIYQPRERYAYVAGRLSPLLNTNHLAAYLGFGSCVAFGSLLARRSIPRALSGSMFVVTGVTSLLQSSRGATGALIFGLVTIVILHFSMRRNFGGGRAQAALLAGCAVAAVIIVGVVMSDAREHLASRDLVKMDAAKSSLALVAGSPWTGFGRGAFETVFSAVRESRIYMTWTNPEDLLIQWLVEWGVPFTVVGLGMIGWALRPQVLFNAVTPAAGPWVAIAATVLHELVDYHLEVPGMVALVAVAAAAISSADRTKPAKTANRPLDVLRVTSFVGAALTLGLAAWLLADRGHALPEERRRLSAEAADGTVSPQTFQDDVRASMLRYPAEPFLPLLGAVKAQASGSGSIIPWIGRALERNPRFGRAHLVLARGLARRNRSQARLEYRLAWQYDANLHEVVEREVVPLIGDRDEAFEVVPDGPAGVAMLEKLSEVLAPRLPATVYELHRELERRAPTNSIPAQRRAEAAVRDVIEGEPWCTDPRCRQLAATAVDQWVSREPDQCRPRYLAAQLELAGGVDPAKALAKLQQASERVSNQNECTRLLVELALAKGQPRIADERLESLMKRGCGTRGECEELYGWAAGIQEGRGHDVAAMALYRRIVDNNPTREDALERIGELGAKTGMMSDAIDAFRILAARHPEDPRWPARMADLRGKALQRPLPSVP